MNKYNTFLEIAQSYADSHSGCSKVSVGSLIVGDNGTIISAGANKTYPNLCKTSRGCMRVEKYGENSKLHRNPEDCRAIHSEIDAIASAQHPLAGCTIFVTRYPCEACARAIVSAGITKVVYGREQEISDETKIILEGITVIWHKEWTAPDTTI